ncbi:dnaJ homolog subfamily C member 24 isoform X1 [Hyla sarda]|uniref:dnaJ homolog subfamily C member 24 isoform X1 n=1 Tax=Hyla sarda TaxID=327740 RepID=UPI0024C28208|nr:dnaJ homolog subfamily C member 24 isoform X1 [Hyla sarda]XP_056382632.1 dnaJ homolog subfamily C member 24 isoform X1 [Hyla sarda]XP_056382633.1 dnaJ homolog subfamily C member 24 isoform X1 [Hyla sarda]XP_056382634.1 dnaJ homolog subfamily C member 24 isoform X1 [Hyla sarda]XP_056382635.1 dnaJ homolog subfamily C member 24 isoform X1 [Hyla sarda]
MTSEDEDWYSILGAHPSDSQAQLKQKYQKLALLVQAHPVLWKENYNCYGDQHLQNQAWKRICEALCPDWVKLTQLQQEVFEEDLRKKWISLQDFFLKKHRKAERRGSSPSQVPFYDELLFLLFSRGPKPSEGSNWERESLAEFPAALDQQEWKPNPTLSAEVKEELEGNQAGLSRMHTPAIALPSAKTSAVAPVPTRVAHPHPTVHPAHTRRQGQRTLRASDRELIQRVHSNDKFDRFGREMASSCRRMRPEVRHNFMSYVYCAAAVFDSPDPLLDVESLINDLQSFVGHQNTLEDVSTSTQTNTIDLSAPSSPPTTDS